MKKYVFAVLLAMLLLLCGCTKQTNDACIHIDADANGFCDSCKESVMVYVDFYAINDLHGKLADADSHPGVDELTTYLKKLQTTDTHSLFLSVGDMWQGSAESNMTKGLIMTDWMNQLDFVAMTLGNHEYDWGEAYIEQNDTLAEFPFLAINIYDRATDEPVEYCQPSVVVDRGGVQIGIIGAIGDCYSSISSDKVQDVYFKTGSDLTALVKAESQRLRSEGVDFIVYTLHDGYGQSKTGSTTSVTGSQLRSYYDTSLSDGYVDLVFEGHTHQRYLLRDEYGVYHLQNGGDNKGISHVEVAVNSVTGEHIVTDTKLISTSVYDSMEDDPIVEELLDKYEEMIAPSNRVVGQNAAYRSGNAMRQLVADLYLQAGLEKWGDDYDITLGGGFVSIRSPGNLPAGEVTYAMLQSLFPFDNELVLCSVKGSDLLSKFINTDNDSYFICRSDNRTIDPNGTYYIIVDTYTSSYAPNRLTEIARYGADIFARDLLADYITAGGLN